MRRGIALALALCFAAACNGPSAIEGLRETPASELSPELPALPFARWVEELMRPTTPRWRTRPCAGAECVEVWARHANGLHFGIVVESRGNRFEIGTLFLEVEGERRHFERIEAWAIAVAALAPRSQSEGRAAPVSSRARSHPPLLGKTIHDDRNDSL